MSDLQSRLSDLARNFANAVLEALRGAPLQELFASGGREGASSERSARSAAPAATRKERTRSSGRLQRRSPEDIAKALEEVVGLVKKHKDGRRAEQIRTALGMQAKEMPRVLKEGLSTKKLKCKGQKRATVYFAA
ncbi:MAG: hypothetical protein M3O46_06115 [Myxococcota bacterium]|nr:hypothetical protein [Myxococcota bacterium]